MSSAVLLGHVIAVQPLKYQHWAQVLFEGINVERPRPHQPVFLWIKAWRKDDIGVWQEFGPTRLAGTQIGINDHVFLRHVNGTFTDLGAFGSYPGALINKQGTIVIVALEGPPTSGLTIRSSFIRQPGSGKLQQIPSRVPGASVDAASINQLGVIAGDAFLDTVNNVDHAFIYANGKMTDLGVLPATGVNS